MSLACNDRGIAICDEISFNWRKTGLLFKMLIHKLMEVHIRGCHSCSLCFRGAFRLLS